VIEGIDMGETWSELGTLVPKLNGHRLAKNLMEVFPRKIEFDLQGEEGPFVVSIQNGQIAVSKGATDKADLVVAGDSAEFAKVVRGKVDVSHPIARGQITIEKGKVSEMTLLNRILWSVQRGA
jgi:putative sterol carrier protein